MHDAPTRSLAEILDPQPEASVVIKRLLDPRLKKSHWELCDWWFLLREYAFVPVSRTGSTGLTRTHRLVCPNRLSRLSKVSPSFPRGRMPGG